MIRQICPHCFQTVELPDSAAGTDAPCPKCSKAIPVPGSYSPTVDPGAGPVATSTTKEASPAAVSVSPSPDWPAPPPGYVPPREPTAAPSSPSPPTEPPGELTNSAGFALSPTVLAWLPAACLTLALFATLFTWVGSYPGDVRVYTQSPWQALFATFTTNPLPEDLLTDEKPIEQRLHSSWWLLPYFPILLVTLVIAWAERVIRHPDPATIPGPLAWLPQIWPRRFYLLTGLSLLLLLLVTIQVSRGLGLEVAIREMVSEKYANAAEDPTAKKYKTAVNAGKELAQFSLSSTIALQLAIVSHVLAVAAAGGLVWLERRGNKQPPRVEIFW